MVVPAGRSLRSFPDHDDSSLSAIPDFHLHMKSKDIKRSVQPYSATRAAGDAPSMGRVARMRGTGLPKQRRGQMSNEGSRGKRGREYRNKLVRGWSVTMCGLAVVILAVVIFLWLVPKMKSGRSEAEQISLGHQKEVRVASQFASPSEDEALALVKQALSVREPERVDGFFRSGTASQQEVVDFLRGMESVDGVIERYTWLSSMDANGLSIDGVLVNFTGVEKPIPRLALLTHDAAGKWKVDFEALARVVKPAWNEIQEKGTALARVRVYVAKDSYYNGAFRDDKQWICYKMASSDTEEFLLGYCRIGSRQAAALDWMFSRGENVTRATLEIQRVEGAESRQFEILKVVAEDWVVGEVPFDEGFNEFN